MKIGIIGAMSVEVEALKAKLERFEAFSESLVPANSLLREFIGNFDYNA